MYRHHSWFRGNEQQEDANRQTASLAGVAVILLLLIAGLYLVQNLRTKSLIEDCLMAGRRNCDAVAASTR
ncbi:MAG: hypothetical protein AB7O80_18885 [Acetobacteraceae bacterium]